MKITTFYRNPVETQDFASLPAQAGNINLTVETQDFASLHVHATSQMAKIEEVAGGEIIDGKI